MNLKTFAETYNLHDSFFSSVHYAEDNHELIMILEFSFWMQKNFVEGSAEEGTLQLIFSNVSEYSCSDGDPCGNFVGILEAKIENEALIISLMDDEENNYFEMKIMAEDVIVTEVPNTQDAFEDME